MPQLSWSIMATDKMASAFLILNLHKQAGMWLIFETFKPSSLTTFFKFYSFHRLLYKGCSMAMGKNCVAQNGHRESYHHLNSSYQAHTQKKIFRTFFFTTPFQKCSSVILVAPPTQYCSKSLLSHPCNNSTLQ